MKENPEANPVPVQLILDELDGSLLPEDRIELDNWKTSSPDHMDLYREITAISENTALLGIRQQLDPEQSWTKFSASLFPEEAAAKNNVFKLRRSGYIKWAAAAVFLIVGSLATLNYWKNAGTEYVQTGKNEHRSLKLPDGTEVIINQNTSLSYNSRNFSSSRIMKLEKGEAYFTVKHDQKRPFSIRTEDLTIEDLGTSFNVNVEPKQVVVVVNSGKVAMAHQQTQHHIILNPADKGVLDKATHTLVKSTNDNINYKAWYNNTLNYQQTKLSVVAGDLQKLYGITVTFQDSQLKERRLSAYFKDKTPEEIMQIIGTSLGLKINTTNGNYTLSNP